MRYFMIFALILISVAVATPATRKGFLLGKSSQSNDKPQASPPQQSSENQSEGDDASTAGAKECTMNQNGGAADKSSEGQNESETEEPKETPPAGGAINPGSASKKNSRRF